MAYEELTAAEGRKFLPSVQNLFPKPLADENFFVEPWKNRELADCAEFRLGTGKDGSDEVLFFVSDATMVDFLKGADGDIYLFGAYNQISVCQMRARGSVTLAEDRPDAEEIRKRVRAAIISKMEARPIGRLREEQTNERFALLEKGLLFCFRISSYAYQMYERG